MKIFGLALISLLVLGCKKENVVVPPPSIESFMPESGIEGIMVTITGSNFSSTSTENKILFDRIATTVVDANATTLTVKAPVGFSTGKISITVGGQSATSTNDFVRNYEARTLAGSGGNGSQDGAGTVAQFFSPNALAIDGSGNLYVVDSYVGRIRKVTASGVTSTLANGGVWSVSDAAFVVNPDGNTFYLKSSVSNVIWALNGSILSTFAGDQYHSGYLDGDAPTARFSSIYSLARDAAGNLYALEIGENGTDSRIRKITPNGLVTTLAGGAAGYADGVGADARFAFQYYSRLTVDVNGNVYVADSGNHRIRKVAPDGTVTTIAGSGETGMIDGDASVAQFQAIGAITIDPQGNIFVGDVSNSRIRMVTPNGTVKSFNLAPTPTYGFKDGDMAGALFRLPTTLVSDQSGNIYVTDMGNNRIRKIVR